MNTTLSICAAKIQSSHWFPNTTRNAVRPVSQLANYSVLSDIHFPPCHSECAQSALISPKRWGQSRQKLFGLKKDEAFQVWYVRIEHIAQLLEVSIPMWYRGVEFFLFGPRPNLASVETVSRSTLIDMQVFCIGFDFSQRGINFKVGSGQSLQTPRAPVSTNLAPETSANNAPDIQTLREISWNYTMKCTSQDSQDRTTNETQTQTFASDTKSIRLRNQTHCVQQWHPCENDYVSWTKLYEAL